MPDPTQKMRIVAEFDTVAATKAADTLNTRVASVGPTGRAAGEQAGSGIDKLTAAALRSQHVVDVLGDLVTEAGVAARGAAGGLGVMGQEADRTAARLDQSRQRLQDYAREADKVKSGGSDAPRRPSASSLSDLYDRQQGDNELSARRRVDAFIAAQQASELTGLDLIEAKRRRALATMGETAALQQRLNTHFDAQVTGYQNNQAADALKKEEDERRRVDAFVTQAQTKELSGLEKIEAQRHRALATLGQTEDSQRKLNIHFDAQVAGFRKIQAEEEKLKDAAGLKTLATNIKGFVQSPLAAAGEAAESFVLKFGVIGVTAGVVAGAVALAAVAIKQTADAQFKAVDAIEDMSAATGLSTDQVQRFNAVALYGHDHVGNLAAAMRKMSEDFATGGAASAKVSAALTSLGVVQHHTAEGTVDLGRALGDAFTALEKIKDPALFNLFSGDLLGSRLAASLRPPIRSWTELNALATEHAAIITEKDKKAADDYHTSVTTLGLAWDRVALRIKSPIVELAGTVAAMLNQLLEFEKNHPNAATAVAVGRYVVNPSAQNLGQINPERRAEDAAYEASHERRKKLDEEEQSRRQDVRVAAATAVRDQYVAEHGLSEERLKLMQVELDKTRLLINTQLQLSLAVTKNPDADLKSQTAALAEAARLANVAKGQEHQISLARLSASLEKDSATATEAASKARVAAMEREATGQRALELRSAEATRARQTRYDDQGRAVFTANPNVQRIDAQALAIDRLTETRKEEQLALGEHLKALDVRRGLEADSLRRGEQVYEASLKLQEASGTLTVRAVEDFRLAYHKETAQKIEAIDAARIQQKGDQEVNVIKRDFERSVSHDPAQAAIDARIEQGRILDSQRATADELTKLHQDAAAAASVGDLGQSAARTAADKAFNDQSREYAYQTSQEKASFELQQLDKVKNLQLAHLEEVKAQSVQQKLALEREKLAIELNYVGAAGKAQQSNIDREHAHEVDQLADELKRRVISGEAADARLAAIDAKYNEQRRQRTVLTDEQIAAAQQSAVTRSTGVLIDQQRQVFEGIKSDVDRVFDAMFTKSQSVWSAIASIIKGSLLGALKQVVDSQIAAALTGIVTGRPVQIQQQGIHAVPVFGGAASTTTAVLGRILAPQAAGASGPALSAAALLPQPLAALASVIAPPPALQPKAEPSTAEVDRMERLVMAAIRRDAPQQARAESALSEKPAPPVVHVLPHEHLAGDLAEAVRSGAPPSALPSSFRNDGSAAGASSLPVADSGKGAVPPPAAPRPQYDTAGHAVTEGRWASERLTRGGLFKPAPDEGGFALPEVPLSAMTGIPAPVRRVIQAARDLDRPFSSADQPDINGNTFAGIGRLPESKTELLLTAAGALPLGKLAGPLGKLRGKGPQSLGKLIEEAEAQGKPASSATPPPAPPKDAAVWVARDRLEAMVAEAAAEDRVRLRARYIFSGSHRQLHNTGIPDDLLKSHRAGEFPLTQVPLEGLTATEGGLWPGTIRHFINGGESNQEARVIRHDGTNYVIDGHHRAVAAQLLGQDSFLARHIGTEHLRVQRPGGSFARSNGAWDVFADLDEGARSYRTDSVADAERFLQGAVPAQAQVAEASQLHRQDAAASEARRLSDAATAATNQHDRARAEFGGEHPETYRLGEAAENANAAFTLAELARADAAAGREYQWPEDLQNGRGSDRMRFQWRRMHPDDWLSTTTRSAQEARAQRDQQGVELNYLGAEPQRNVAAPWKPAPWVGNTNAGITYQIHKAGRYSQADYHLTAYDPEFTGGGAGLRPPEWGVYSQKDMLKDAVHPPGLSSENIVGFASVQHVTTGAAPDYAADALFVSPTHRGREAGNVASNLYDWAGANDVHMIPSDAQTNEGKKFWDLRGRRGTQAKEVTEARIRALRAQVESEGGQLAAPSATPATPPPATPAAPNPWESAGRDMAQQAWDAHGKKVPADLAWQFKRNLRDEDPGGGPLPYSTPTGFREAFARYSRKLQAPALTSEQAVEKEAAKVARFGPAFKPEPSSAYTDAILGNAYGDGPVSNQLPGGLINRTGQTIDGVPSAAQPVNREIAAPSDLPDPSARTGPTGGPSGFGGTLGAFHKKQRDFAGAGIKLLQGLVGFAAGGGLSGATQASGGGGKSSSSVIYDGDQPDPSNLPPWMNDPGISGRNNPPGGGWLGRGGAPVTAGGGAAQQQPGLGGLFGNLGGLFAKGPGPFNEKGESISARSNLAGFFGFGKGPGGTYGSGTFGTGISGAAKSLGKSDAAALGGGLLLSDGIKRGGTIGTLEDTAGGALIGFKYGGPVGAAVGAAVGLTIGILRQTVLQTLAEQVRKRVKDEYHLDINRDTAQQIADIAKSQYGGSIAVALHSQQVMQMLGLYAETTGQKFGLVGPQQATLAYSGGQLQQAGTYHNGSLLGFQSGLKSLQPLAGTILGPTYDKYGQKPSEIASPSFTLSLDGKSSAAFLQGQTVEAMGTSEGQQAVSSANLAANTSSFNRLQQLAALQSPGTVIA